MIKELIANDKSIMTSKKASEQVVISLDIHQIFCPIKNLCIIVMIQLKFQKNK